MMITRPRMILAGIGAVICLAMLSLHLYWRHAISTTDTGVPNHDLSIQSEQDEESLDLFLPNLGTITYVALSPNAEHVAVATQTWMKGKASGDAASIWSRRNRQLVARLPIDDEVTSLTFSPGGEWLGISYWFGAVQLFDTRTWTVQATLGDKDKQSFTAASLAFSADGAHLVAAYFPEHLQKENLVRIWNIATGTCEVIGTIPYSANCLSISRDGRFLATADFCSNLIIWTGTPKKQHWVLETHSDPDSHETGIKGVAFLPDCRTLVSAGTDGQVQLRDVVSRQVRSFPAKVGKVRAMALRPAGNLVAVSGRKTGSAVHTMRVFQLPDAKELKDRGMLPTSVSCLCFSQDGKWLGVGTYAANPYGTEGVHVYLIPSSKLVRLALED